jgi:recombination protein RecR
MLPDSLRSLSSLFSRLPGVGEKTAQRFALHLAQDDTGLSHQLGKVLSDLDERIRPCDNCRNIAEVRDDESAVCSICSDPRREASLLCIVGRIPDLLAIEASGAMRGRYFVLGRLLSPLDGVGPDELPLAQLRAQLALQNVTEVILATPPSIDGEATALLLAQELSQQGIAISRIASGVPHGGELEFADRITLGRAIGGRQRVEPR